MNFLLAKKEDGETILGLYKSAIGSQGCTWDEGYPSVLHMESDMEREALFCLKTDEGEIVGAISIDDDKQVENLPCWSLGGAELARLVVKESYQNQGVAGKLLTNAMEILKQRGYRYVHFLVSKNHIKALRAYDKLKFDNVGESDLYNGSWWCYEKKLQYFKAKEC